MARCSMVATARSRRKLAREHDELGTVIGKASNMTKMKRCATPSRPLANFPSAANLTDSHQTLPKSRPKYRALRNRHDFSIHYKPDALQNQPNISYPTHKDMMTSANRNSMRMGNHGIPSRGEPFLSSGSERNDDTSINSVVKGIHRDKGEVRRIPARYDHDGAE